MARPLTDLEVLVLDCQATSARPEKGHLLEIGWARIGSTIPSHIESHLLPLPDGQEIPRRVQRITGISTGELAKVTDVKPIWKRLAETAQAIAETNQTETCPTVIHFSRFEEPYLRRLHHLYRTTSANGPFPFQILCTHEMTRRLLPELPRRGLRAVAGYFGHSVPELRRSAHHVAATAAVWQSTVDILAEKHGIQTLEDLLDWLASSDVPRPPGNRRTYPMNPQARVGLPDRPGVYRLLRSNGDVLYVGKASSLKRRVQSYFQSRSAHPDHILEMLTQAQGLDVTVTGSTLEAALLESDEIKRLSPPYNIALRERDRRLAFSSRDLRHFSPEPDELHPIGPLPSQESLLPLQKMIELLEGAELDDAIRSEALGIPEEYAPDADAFHRGLALFQEKYVLPSAEVTRALISLGSRLWRERLGASSEAEEEETFELKLVENVAERQRWTPDRVTERLEEMIRRGAYFIRRGHWFCLLSESTVIWTSAAERILLTFEKGAVCHREVLPKEATASPPPGYNKPFSERRASFGVPTYDRMSVLTQEIRRLVSEEREVALHLSCAVVLDREKLRVLLRWV
jgi:DNA polymerase-3 subunit epsilon